MKAGAYKQDATYWGSPVSNGLGGYSFAAPKALKVRWEQKHEQYNNDMGDTKVSSAVVFLQQAVDTGGYLFLGKSTATDPTNVAGAFRIEQYVEIPALRFGSPERRGYL